MPECNQCPRFEWCAGFPDHTRNGLVSDFDAEIDLEYAVLQKCGFTQREAIVHRENLLPNASFWTDSVRYRLVNVFVCAERKSSAAAARCQISQNAPDLVRAAAGCSACSAALVEVMYHLKSTSGSLSVQCGCQLPRFVR
jgi:hypothetical protein